ncbi:hypothetical protein PV328_011345 [Microctonus aethiopoides]|uniref:Major facilitator superfamily (MFS) profile domain-containing protein n=1 Tax=Microctonus aethiopoides TaxID=144406 RepID=A0AA39C4F3_9HYME|nr:hypothetical protein PV328_011345 [Microctonus aethiopoides]
MPRASVVHMTSTATKPHHLSQVLATLALSMGTLSCGLAKGYTSPAVDSILDSQPHLYQSTGNDTWWAFSVTKQEVSWVASLSMLGAWFGAMIGDWIMRRGRRLALRLTSLPLAAVWILTGIAPCVELVFTTSFLGGFCCAIITMVAQVYISEISMPGIRGCLSAMLKVVSHVGVLFSYIAGTYLNWRQSAVVVAIAPTMLFVGTLFIPETPSYLVLNGRDEEAAGSLKWLRGEHVDITQELQVIKTNVLASRAKQYELSFRSSLFTPRLYKPIAITCGLMFFQRFSGANAFIYYAVMVFRQTLGGVSPHGATIAIGFVQLLASLLSGFLIDIVGRLPLLIASTVFMSLALAGFGSYAYYNSMSQNIIENSTTQSMGQYDWIPLLCVLVFTTALALGISPISWLLIGELFPLEYRGLGSSISTSFSYFCAFFGIKLFMDFQQLLGLHGAFWFYAAVAVCGLCFVVCCVPETKGKQLDEMNPNYAQQRGAYPNQHNQNDIYNNHSIININNNSTTTTSMPKFLQSLINKLKINKNHQCKLNFSSLTNYCGIFVEKTRRIKHNIGNYISRKKNYFQRQRTNENFTNYQETNFESIAINSWDNSNDLLNGNNINCFVNSTTIDNYHHHYHHHHDDNPQSVHAQIESRRQIKRIERRQRRQNEIELLRNGNFDGRQLYEKVPRRFMRSMDDLTDLDIEIMLERDTTFNIPANLLSGNGGYINNSEEESILERYRRRYQQNESDRDYNYLKLYRSLSRLDRIMPREKFIPGKVHYEREYKIYGRDTVALIYYKTCYL